MGARTKWLFGVFQNDSGMVFIQKIHPGTILTWEREPWMRPGQLIAWYDTKPKAKALARARIEKMEYVLKLSKGHCK